LLPIFPAMRQHVFQLGIQKWPSLNGQRTFLPMEQDTHL
jgi:hypothetical protein